jgi:hypothetical protein
MALKYHTQEQIDHILDLIGLIGIENISISDRMILDNYSVDDKHIDEMFDRLKAKITESLIVEKDYFELIYSNKVYNLSERSEYEDRLSVICSELDVLKKTIVEDYCVDEKIYNKTIDECAKKLAMLGKIDYISFDDELEDLF